MPVPLPLCREEHVPVLIHVTEMTQPQGHSTSGSHERYKTKDRLTWEDEHDCLLKMREWMIASAISTEQELDELETEAKKYVRECQREAAGELVTLINAELEEAAKMIEQFAEGVSVKEKLTDIVAELRKSYDAGRKEIVSAVRKTLRATAKEDSAERQILVNWLNAEKVKNNERYNTKLFSNTPQSPLMFLLCLLLTVRMHVW
jgi:hypothetical protein